MVSNSNDTKRIAFVVAALTGEELQASQRDASTIFTILTDPTLGMCHPKQSKLVHECRSRAEFELAISSVLESWDSSTQLILYFSGHGKTIRNNYCFKFGEKNYPFRNLLTELETNGVCRAILILDACFSGAVIGTKSDGISTIIEENDIPQGIAIIASSKKTQWSYELKDGSHSVFTSLLCKGIRTGLDGTPTDHGLISVSDIVTYIQNKLSRDDEFSSYPQNPLFKIDKADKDIWITKNPTGTTTKQEAEKYRDIFQNTYLIKSPDELRSLYENNAPSYHPCLDANIDDLDLSLLEKYSNKIQPGFFSKQRLQEVLSKLFLYSPISHGGEKFLHKSAVLCFHRMPHILYPQARSIFVVGDPGAPNFHREDVYGSLSYQVEQLIQKVENNVSKKSYIAKNGTRRDLADIDILVVREMISNAIAHRDYNANGTVKVAVTEEAVEVYNPGSFPPRKSWNKLLNSSLSGSEPADAAIALYLTNLLVYEGVGRGFSIFKRYIEENGSDSLTCQEEPGLVCIRLLRRSVSQELVEEDNYIIQSDRVFYNASDQNIGDQNIRNQNIVFNYLRERQTSSPKYIPYRGVANFVGRQKEMTLLHEKLQQSNTVAISALAGMGGVGKTELATQYARQYEADYPGGICWLNASRDTNLATEIIQFYQRYVDNQREIPQESGGRQLTVFEQAIWCWKNWQPDKGLVLVILDDVMDLSSCQQLLPTNNRFRLLITTRIRNLDPNIVEEISLDVLSLDKSIELLSALVGKRLVEGEIQTAAELCQWLGYLPLGLYLVGRYVADDPDLSLQEILQRLQQQRLGDEALYNSLESQTTAQQGVLAAIELSWQKLDAVTKQVAELLSLFAEDLIPWHLVTLTCQKLDWNNADINKAKKQLYKHYFIQRLEGRKSSYKIHPLIHQFLQTKVELTSSVDKLKQAFAAAMVTIAQEIPETPTRSDIESVKDNIPQLAEVAENLTAAISDEDLIWVFTGLNRFYEGQGLYVLAEPWCKQGLSAIKDRLGEEHPSVASSLNNLALLYHSQGRYAEAEPLLQQALELYKRLLGDEHSDVATSLNNLALLYHSQGRYAEAEPLLQQALSMRKRLLGDEHSDVATSLNNLAELYRLQGRYAEAEPLLQQALSMRKRLLGDEHSDVAQSLNNLALLYHSQGRYAEAEPLLQQALSMRKRLLGDEHPSVATSLNNLAELYRLQGRYVEAEPLLQQALSMRKRLLGDEHSDVAQSLNNLALLYHSQGRYAEAEPMYQQALELYQRLLGDEHSDVAQSLNNLALLYHSQGRYAEAEPMYQQALELYQRLLGDEHPDMAQSLNNLAELYRLQGRYAEAEPMYQQALELYKRLLGDEHPDMAQSLNNLALLYHSQGRYVEAEPLYQQTLQILEQQLGAEHPNTITVRNNLKSLHETDQ